MSKHFAGCSSNVDKLRRTVKPSGFYNQYIYSLATKDRVAGSDNMLQPRVVKTSSVKVVKAVELYYITTKGQPVVDKFATVVEAMFCITEDKVTNWQLFLDGKLLGKG